MRASRGLRRLTARCRDCRAAPAHCYRSGVRDTCTTRKRCKSSSRAPQRLNGSRASSSLLESQPAMLPVDSDDDEASVEQSLGRKVDAVPLWYHTFHLPGGVVTPGGVDTYDELRRIPFPRSLTGQRCLDIGTADGFWAFEMERRGAAEVLAIDVRNPLDQDWPGNAVRSQQESWDEDYSRRGGFDLAREALDSEVQWRELRANELSPERMGEFDFVFMGSLLLHLRDPVGALKAVRSVLRGEFLSVDAVSPPLTLLHPRQPVARLEAPGWPLWWKLNLQAYRRLFNAAGLDVADSGPPFFVKPGPAAKQRYNKDTASSKRSRLLLRIEHAVLANVGVLHSWVLARPGEQG
jgi:tRNA (mo5U34)-methyltransferase